MIRHAFKTSPLLLGALLTLTACPSDDVVADGDGSDSTGDDPTTGVATTAPMTTTPMTTVADSSDSGSDSDSTDGGSESDSDSTDGGESSSDSGSTGPGDSSSDGGSSSTGGGAVCGDDLIEGGEVCDGLDLDLQTCVTQGFVDGTLDCLVDCTDFDVSGCGTCGDDVTNGGDVCDGIDVGASTCVTEGFDAGTLGCTVDCSALETSGCSFAPGCIEENIGSATGDGVAFGNTDAEDEDLDQSCAAGGAVDYVIFWTAPSDGLFSIDTFGSSYDTALAIYSDCDSSNELACNDDSFGLQSSLSRFMSTGEGLVIAVSGFAGATGDWVLNINEAVGGSCCAPSDSAGCFDQECTQDVCAADPSCCSQWHQNCSNIASAFCDVCNTPDICGNGTLEAGEDCDAPDFGASSCQTEGFDGGPLACNLADCTIDNSQCIDFDGSCCAENGTPGCTDSDCTDAVCALDPFCCDVAWLDFCAFNAQAICTVCNTPDICGNGITDGTDVCDPPDLDGQSCFTQGFDGGPLGCLADCSDYDTSNCVFFDGECCGVGNPTPGCEDGACSNAVCAIEPFCCDVEWDPICGDIALAECALCQVCGDDVATGAETCDGTDLAGQSCATLGFIGGTLSCDGASNCADFDTSACIPNGGGDCCANNGTPGCDDLICVADVCDAEPSCCDVAWDQVCADAAAILCLPCGGASPCTNCSFEDGDFTDWTVQDLGNPFSPAVVGTAGPGVGFDFFDWAPTDGFFSAQSGFDGDGGSGPFGEITVAKEVGISGTAASAALEFDYRVGYDMTFGAVLDREFRVRIEQLDGTPLDDILIGTLVANTFNPDSGTLLGNVDLTPYLGQYIRFVFVLVVPEDFTGPAQAELDNVRITYS